MTLAEAAAIYTELVRLDEEVPETEIQAKDRITALRSKYHELLMEKMREAGVPFSDRFDAARQAFDLAQNA